MLEDSEASSALHEGRRPANRSARRWIGAIVFLLGTVAVCWAQWHWIHHRLQPGLVGMIAGICLVTLGSAAIDPAAAAAAWRVRPAPWLEIGFLLAVTAAGAAIRLVGLDHFPPGGFFDEVQNSLVAEGILKGGRPIFISEATQMPALLFYPLAALIAAAGKSVATVRAFSGIIGTLTLPAFYLIARRAFVWPVAAATTILLAGSRWHVTFSRIGFLTIVGPLLEILALLALWKAMETKRVVHFLLVGLVVGVGLQSYYSFLLFPAVMAVAVLSFASRLGRRRFWPELFPILRGLALSVLLAAVLLIPLATFAARHPGEFFRRSNTVAIWNPAHHLPWPGALWQNVATHLFMFNFRGDANPRHNWDEAPMLDPIAGVLLAVGLGAALARAWKWPEATWLGWFVVMLLPAILTIEAPQAHRAVGVIPAVYLLIGEGLQAFFAFAAGYAGALRRTIASAAVLIVSLGAASHDLSLYFGAQVQSPQAWDAFEADHHAIGRFLKPYGNRYDIWVNPLFFDYPAERFYVGENFSYDRFRLFEHLPVAPDRIRKERAGLLYVLEPFQEGLFPLFHALYEHSSLGVHRDPFGRPMFIHIVVPGRDLESPASRQAGQLGFLGAYYANEQWTGPPRILRREPAVWFHTHWHEDILAHPFTADWTARLRIDEPGTYNFELVTSGPTVLSVDGKRVFETQTIDRPEHQRVAAALSPGEHLLAVSYWEKSSRATITVSWQPPNGKTEVIPMSVVRPLSAEEYARVRDALPRPNPAS